MNDQLLKLLLIEDDLTQAKLIQEMLGVLEETEFQVTLVPSLSEGLACLRDRSFDAILLDLFLLDSHGLETLLHLKAQVPQVPTIVLTSLDDRHSAIEAVRQEAQDYLVKGRFDSELLVRAINYAIERQRIQATLQQQIEREQLMGRMIEKIRQSLDLNEILQTTVEEVRQFLKTDRVLIFRCRSEEHTTIVAESVETESGQVPSAEVAQALTLLQKCSCSLYTSLTGKSCEDFNQALSDLEALMEFLRETILTVPIWQNKFPQENCLWGQLIAHDYQKPRSWQAWESEFLTQLANQVAIAIKQSELYQEVERLATLDGLTGVANRRRFDQVLEQEWCRLAREQQPLSLAIGDIDFFKAYNDTCGHPAGDDCLRQVAHILQQAIKRPADLVARYGGEEFAIILPNTDALGAQTVAQEIRTQLEQFRLPHPGSLVNDHVTVSLGIATMIPSLNQSPGILVEKADYALLQAKAQGRDRIIQH